MAAIAPASLPEGLPAAPSVHHRLVDVASAAGPVRLHLAEAGAGEPVLLLHGWPQHWYEWQHLLRKLSRRSPAVYRRWRSVRTPDCHPFMRRSAGGIEAWERSRL